MKNFLCTICCRKGSKGLLNKNLIKLDNQPLFMLTINQAKRSKIFNKIVVSTDSKYILKTVKNKVDLVINRPKKLASDSASKIDVIKHALKLAEKKFNKTFDYVCDLDVSSPLRNTQDIIKSKKYFIKKKYSNLITVNEARKNPYFNMVEFSNNGLRLVKNKKIYVTRQESPKVYEMNASIYYWKRTFLINSAKVVNSNTGIYIMPYHRSVDIDDKYDFSIVKALSKINYK